MILLPHGIAGMCHHSPLNADLKEARVGSYKRVSPAPLHSLAHSLATWYFYLSLSCIQSYHMALPTVGLSPKAAATTVFLDLQNYELNKSLILIEYPVSVFF